MKKYAATSLLFACLFITGTLFGQNKAVTIDSMIQRTNRLGLFSGNILVVDGGKVVYKKCIGYTDAAKTAPLTDKYRFHIGSIAKEFNAVGIMMLQEQGKLSLDDKVSKFLPELPAWAAKVRIKNLLQYTSGIPDVKWKTVKGDADNMADLMKLQQLDFEPGSKYNYNNNNVFLQRRILEKLSGMPFNKFVEEKLLAPAGMKTAIVDPDDNTPLMAKSYTNEGKQGSLVYPITGWVAVTLEDFYKWEQALENFKLISPASTQVLVTPFAPGRQCGLGGGTMEGGKLVFHKHDGVSLNYQALLVGNSSKARTVILMTNNKQNSVFDIDAAIENILDGKPYSQPKRSILADFQKQLDTLSGEKVLSFYHNLKATKPQLYAFDNESTLNEIGYSLMGDKNIDAAIVVFEYNITLFPNSGNVYDSLGEAYYNKGDKAKALLNYKRSLQLDPTNGGAKTVIEELEKK
ncbi:serine hydrolase [Mucilaginibacter pedocola]|uniref:Serine hydrolase n=1 Tax=Mucilaginibacter pedocola TaxID=1792845 RepID=A0A1S9P6A0_9SPHI|nr:serine hydrolase [Mucilaginibacter pedocola]OOQ56480.1 serine hydrolase [Mucilaginibacter pedocola]